MALNPAHWAFIMKSAFPVVRGALTLDICSPIFEHLSRWKNSCTLCCFTRQHVLAKWTWPIADAAARPDSHSTTMPTVCKHKDSTSPCPRTGRHFLCCRILLRFHNDIKRRPSSCDVCQGKWGNRDQHRWVCGNVSSFSGGLRDGWTQENARQAAVQ